MSRMIFALMTLAIVSGCSTYTSPRGLSLTVAELGMYSPSWSAAPESCDGCGDCIPCKPYSDFYISKHDYALTAHTAHRCAVRALKEYRMTCGGSHLSYDFKYGFVMAYEDLALNRRPSPPVVPPPKYWNAYYRSCAGKGNVEDWFAGYDAGREMGLNSGISKFNEVYLRRNACYAGDVNQTGYAQEEVYDQAQQSQQAQPPLVPTPQAPVAPPSPYNVQGRY